MPAVLPEEEYPRLAAHLAHVAALWRDGSDLETLARLPDGIVSIDAMTGEARHATAGPIALRLADALRTGLAERLARKGLAVGAGNAVGNGGALTATLELATDTGAIRTDRDRIVHFDFGIEAKVGAAGREFRASRREDHVWHAREPD
jgi:hypothetical protein